MQFPAYVMSWSEIYCIHLRVWFLLNCANPKVHTFWLRRRSGAAATSACLVLPSLPHQSRPRFFYVKLSKRSLKAQCCSSPCIIQKHRRRRKLLCGWEMDTFKSWKKKKLDLFLSPKHLFHNVNIVVREYISKRPFFRLFNCSPVLSEAAAVIFYWCVSPQWKMCF